MFKVSNVLMQPPIEQPEQFTGEHSTIANEDLKKTGGDDASGNFHNSNLASFMKTPNKFAVKAFETPTSIKFAKSKPQLSK